MWVSPPPPLAAERLQPGKQLLGHCVKDGQCPPATGGIPVTSGGAAYLEGFLWLFCCSCPYLRAQGHGKSSQIEVASPQACTQPDPGPLLGPGTCKTADCTGLRECQRPSLSVPTAQVSRRASCTRDEPVLAP